MAQFTAKSLARLLSQVEREVLVDALDLAGMTQLLTSDSIKTIEKLGSELQALRDFGRISQAKDIPEVEDPELGLAITVGDVWRFIMEKVSAISVLKPALDELLAALKEHEMASPKPGVAAAYKAMEQSLDNGVETTGINRDHISKMRTILVTFRHTGHSELEVMNEIRLHNEEALSLFTEVGFVLQRLM